MRRGVDRRTFLRGAGALLALPLLESLRPAVAWAAQDAAAAPKRLVFVFVPNGVNMPNWRPRAGRDLILSPTLEPLAELRDSITVHSGLTLDGGRAHGDGPGDHARSAASFLTAAHPVKTGGRGIKAGTSVDQVAARHFERDTRFASIELGCERGARSGQCDSGYSCAYSSSISWRTPTMPNAKEVDPRLAFERLFLARRKGESLEDAARRRATRRSVLDAVSEDARDLSKGLGRSDRAKLDEYQTAVREIERRLERTNEIADDAGIEVPNGRPGNHTEHVRLMYDVMALALRTDTTRVASFMVGNAGSNRTYRWLGVPEGHHGLSHHGKEEAKTKKIAKVDRYQVEQFAYFLGKLREIEEDGGTLLDNTLVLYGSGISDGNRHNHEDLPIVVAGGGLAHARHVRHARETPLANLYLSMLQRIGVEAETFADSTGTVELV